jgi:hypothetical protein
MTIEPQTSEATRRTRRNILKMGGIAASATLTTVHSASAVKAWA